MTFTKTKLFTSYFTNQSGYSLDVKLGQLSIDEFIYYHVCANMAPVSILAFFQGFFSPWYSIGDFEWIFISLLTSAEFSLQTSENNPKTL